MHRALATPDIIEEVVWSLLRVERGEWIQPVDIGIHFWRANRTHVLSLGLTCRQICETSLDAIWTYAESLRPLFATIANFQPETGKIMGQIYKSDLKRFGYYSKRIRQLHLAPKGKSVSSSAFLRILHANGTQLLLPNIQHLTLSTPSNRDDYIFLLRPGLAHLSIYKIQGPGEGDTFIPATVLDVSRTSLQLQSLIIDSHLSSEDLDTVFALPRLRYIALIHSSGKEMTEWMVIKGDFFQQLRWLGNLQKLYLSCSFRFEPPDCVPAMAAVLPALRDFEICFDVENLSVVSAMLGAASFPVLRDFTFTVTNCSNLQLDRISDWKVLFRNLHRSFPRSMHQVTVNHKFEHPTNMSFSPFLEWVPNDVCKIFVAGNAFEPISRFELVKFLETHPALEHLSLYFQQQPQLAMDTLVDVALNSPVLDQLLLEVDLDTFPSLDVFPICDHNLTTLRLNGATPSNPLETARLIDRLFPKLKQISPNANIFDESWGELQSAIEALQGTREDERRRVGGIGHGG